MTDARELMAMMTPHGIEIGRPFGGIPKLTALDVAGAMGMGHLRPEWAALLMVKYCGEQSRFYDLANWVYVVEGINHRGLRWPEARTELVRDFCTFVAFEFVYLGRCPACNGAGVHKNQKECSVCTGSGILYPSDAWVCANVLEIPEEQFSARGGPSRRKRLAATLERWEQTALAAIGKALAE